MNANATAKQMYTVAPVAQGDRRQCGVSFKMNRTMTQEAGRHWGCAASLEVFPAKTFVIPQQLYTFEGLERYDLVERHV